MSESVMRKLLVTSLMSVAACSSEAPPGPAVTLARDGKGIAEEYVVGNAGADGEGIAEEDVVGNAGAELRHKLEVLNGSNERNAGSVTVVPVAGDVGFAVDLTVTLHHMLPNTLYTLSRAPETFRPLHDDGICQRAAGLYPWEQPNSPGFPPAPVFLINTYQGTQTPITVATDDRGDGSVSFHSRNPTIPHGYVFDIMFRIFSASDAAISDCFQVHVL